MIEITGQGEVTWTNEKGEKVISNWYHGEYQPLVARRFEQLEIEKENNAARQSYMLTVVALQDSINKGLIVPAPPPKPKRKTLSDTGVPGETDFDPPLPDLVYPAPPKPGNKTGAVPDHTNMLTQDQKLDAIMAAVVGMAKTLDALVKKAGA